MTKNLFIMHTQYNLILSASVLSRYSESENTLVLYAEFGVTDEMREALSGTFDRVIVVTDKFVSKMKPFEEIKFIRKCMKKVRQIRNESFDNVFMSQERIFDMIVCARAKKINPKAKCYAVEEDVYYSINEEYNSDDFVYTESKRQKRRKFLYALFLAGYPYNYRDVHYCYGMSSEYDGVNLLYPELARRELNGKELIEITRDELSRGIEAIYSEKKIDYPKAESYTVFFFDLMSRYKDKQRVKSIVEGVIQKSKEQGRKVLFKYHPRETEKFADIDGVFEIPHLIPAEKVLLDFEGKDTIVFGNATTSCVVASKLGAKVISICKLEFPTNTKIHDTMEKMGIQCITEFSQI